MGSSRTFNLLTLLTVRQQLGISLSNTTISYHFKERLKKFNYKYDGNDAILISPPFQNKIFNKSSLVLGIIKKYDSIYVNETSLVSNKKSKGLQFT